LEVPVSATTPKTEIPVVGGVDERAAARALGMSVGWLRKDRYDKRLIPFFRLGGRVRYDLDRVRASLAAREEGGHRRNRRAE
jgi:hypothetical protein